MILQVILFYEGDNWVAQCLEMDIAVLGFSVEDTICEFGQMLAAHVAIRKKLELSPLEKGEIPPAPDVYWQQLKRAISLPSFFKKSGEGEFDFDFSGFIVKFYFIPEAQKENR